MLENFAAGGAAINQICAAYGLGFKVFDLALDMPTGDITEADAMDEKACVATMAFGMEAIAGGTDLLGRRRDGHRQHHRRGGHLHRALRRRRPSIGSGAARASTTRA